MEVARQPKLPDDRAGECRSFGSNYCPSSQSRKISIGIMIDSVAKKKLGAIKKEKAAKIENIGGLKKSSREAGEMKQSTSPWRSTRSVSPIPEPQKNRKEKLNGRSAGGSLKKQKREINTPVTHSVQFFTNQTLTSHCGGDKQDTSKGFTYKRKGSKNGDSQELAFEKSQEAKVPDKAVTEEKNEGGTERLKMNLWKILEKVSSPKSQPFDSKAREKDADNLKSDKEQAQKTDDAVGKPLRNSDTIETDCENPDLNLTRPVTLRRRDSAKILPEKKRAAPSSRYRRKLQEKENNAFSFAEGLLQKSMSSKKNGYQNISSLRPRSNCFSGNNDIGVGQEGFSGKVVEVNCDSSISARQNDQRKSSSIERSHIGFAHNNADEIQEKTCRSETLFSTDRMSSLGNKKKDIHRSPPLDMPEHSVPNSRNKEREDHQLVSENSQKSLYKQRSKEQQDINSTEVEKKGKQEECGPSLKTVVDTNEDFPSPSPTFKFHAPSLTPSPTLKPRSFQINEAPNSPALETTGFAANNIRSFRSLGTSKDNDATEFEISPKTKVTPPGKFNAENDLSDLSSEEDKDPDGSEEGSPIIKVAGQKEADDFFPVIRPVERSKFLFSPIKDFQSHEGSRDKYDPISPCVEGAGIGESDSARDQLLSEPDQGDELERVLMLFALSLEKFRNKMKMATRKKSSDILLSVSEEINFQLQNVKSQIQKDLGKLKSFSKLKIKEIETTFQEQEEKLKTIHDKFKEDIHQHLQDCKSSVEELEEHQIVINEAVKKQKTSHQKLLTQVEEEIGERLNDAQRNIASVHKLARGKMAQLRHVVAECLNEDVLS